MTDEPADEYDEPGSLAAMRAEYQRLRIRRDELIADGADPNELETPDEPPPMSGPHNGQIVFYPPPTPPLPPVHHHRWAWAQLVNGGQRQVCYDCGTER